MLAELQFMLPEDPNKGETTSGVPQYRPAFKCYNGTHTGSPAISFETRSFSTLPRAGHEFLADSNGFGDRLDFNRLD